VVVNECPKSMKLTPTAEDDSLIVQGPDETSYQMPLTIRGVISCHPVRCPTDQEFLDEDFLERYELLIPMSHPVISATRHLAVSPFIPHHTFHSTHSTPHRVSSLTSRASQTGSEVVNHLCLCLTISLVSA
jgi:hypothetical protein